MNIKALRKNYKTLSLIERHSLFVSAIVRKDESEENAVVAASPVKLFEMPDFTHLYSKVLSLQMIVMIYKAEAWTNWQVFNEMETTRAEKHSRLALYFFFVYSDAWTAVCEKLKIDAEAVAEMMFPSCFCFSVSLCKMKIFGNLPYRSRSQRVCRLGYRRRKVCDDA